MVKILVLQQLYDWAYDALEYRLLDRRSFLQLLDLTESSSLRRQDDLAVPGPLGPGRRRHTHVR